jgi:hypothetical protein
VYGPGADFYRLARNATWIAPIELEIAPDVRYDCVLSDVTTASSAVVRFYYRELSRDPESGSVVLVAR